MNRYFPLTYVFVLYLLPILTACTPRNAPTAAARQSMPHPIPFIETAATTAPNTIVAAQTFTTTPYLEELDIALDQVEYLPLLEEVLPLNDDERARLIDNGFVVSDRIRWNRFVEAYAWIYWKDLPVLVTTDSLLHAFHESYVDILKDLELTTLMPQLSNMLTETHATLATQRAANDNPDLDPLYQDVDIYLAVASNLLQGGAGTDSTVQEYVALATAANAHADIGRSYQPELIFLPLILQADEAVVP